MTSAMTRPEDTVRGPRLYRGETDEEEVEIGTPESSSFQALSQNSQQDDSLYPEEEESRPGTALGDAPANVSKQTAGPKMLTPEETIELARNAVESGIQDTKRSLAGSEAVTDVVKPKLTIDLGHSNIARIPEPVVDLIKDEVERLVGIRFWTVSSEPCAVILIHSSTAPSYTNHDEDYPYPTINFSIFPIDSRNARIYVISTSERTISVNFQKEYV
jgi:hypothetical protein